MLNFCFQCIHPPNAKSAEVAMNYSGPQHQATIYDSDGNPQGGKKKDKLNERKRQKCYEETWV